MGADGDLFGGEAELRTPRGAIPRWARRYGYGQRQIKNWLAAGREAGELPPFDEPGQLPGWFEKHVGRVPKRLQAAIERETGPAPARKAEPVEREVFEMPVVDPSELGAEQQLENYRTEWVRLGKLRARSLEQSDFTRASGYLDQQNKVSAEIRQLEKLIPQILEQRGDLRPTAEVRRVTLEALKVLRVTLFARGLLAAERLAGLTAQADVTRVWSEEINEAFREASAAGFEETLQLEG